MQTDPTLQGMAALQGRGAFLAFLRQAEAQQKMVHAEMERLKELSKVKGSSIFLELHRYSRGNWVLRWRLKQGRVFKHVLWCDIQIELNALPLAIKKHYEAQNLRSLELNTLDIVLQQTIKWLSNHLTKSRTNKSGASSRPIATAESRLG